MTSNSPAIDYRRRQRHILLDMHIPDFNERFLKGFDPAGNVELYARSGADSVMVYCNSIVGLSYWPTDVGKSHPGLGGRDIVGETVGLLHDRGIAACAYYSVNFNNWAYEHNPTWRIQLAATEVGPYGDDFRFAVCCPTSSEFRDFACAQVEQLSASYEFDAFFLDMMFWPGVCVCENCRDRYRADAGTVLPEIVDWWAPEWCRFQARRELWLSDQYAALANAVTRHRAIPVFSNQAPIFAGSEAGLSLGLAASNDLIGGDVGAGPAGAFAFCQLASRISSSVVQYMNAGPEPISGAAQLRSFEEVRSHALLATLFGAQFMTIDAVLPDGRVNAPTYDQLGAVFDAIKPYEQFIGGRPIADIAVYYSPSSNVNFDDNGKHIRDIVRPSSSTWPHAKAVVGVCAALRRAHLPVGVITHANLHDLSEFPVVVLPNVLRMDEEEFAEFRRYVDRGGHLYASGYTSLVGLIGEKHTDFGLADLFGCHFAGKGLSSVSYIRPVSEATSAAILPAAFVAHGQVNPLNSDNTGSPRLLIQADTDATVLAKLTLPYGTGRGNRVDMAWASIFNSPPWEDTDDAVIVEHAYGDGRVIYSGCDIEASTDNIAAERVFVALIRSLLRHPPTIEAETHQNVWVVGFDEPEHRRIRVNLLNHSDNGPNLPVPNVALRIRPPKGRAFRRLCRLPADEPLDFEVRADGRLHVDIRGLDTFAMLSAEY